MEILFLILPFALSSACIWAQNTACSALTHEDGLPIFGSTGVPEVEDLRDVITKGGWFEATSAGFATFGREKIMQAIVKNPTNSSKVDVKFPSKDNVTVESRVWAATSPSVAWVAALWDAGSVIFGQEGVNMSAYDTTSLANVWFSMMLGRSAMRLQPCDSLNVSDHSRTLYGGSFNTPGGPETRMVSLFRYQEQEAFTMILPKYPGVRVDAIPIREGLVLDQNNQCTLLWSGTY